MKRSIPQLFDSWTGLTAAVRSCMTFPGSSMSTSSISTVKHPSSIGVGADGSYPYQVKSSKDGSCSAMSATAINWWFLRSIIPLTQILSGLQMFSVLSGWLFQAAILLSDKFISPQTLSVETGQLGPNLLTRILSRWSWQVLGSWKLDMSKCLSSSKETFFELIFAVDFKRLITMLKLRSL